MEVLSRCGHAVHEDLPDKVSSEYMYHCMIMLRSIIAITELKMEFNKHKTDRCVPLQSMYDCDVNVYQNHIETTSTDCPGGCHYC